MPLRSPPEIRNALLRQGYGRVAAVFKRKLKEGEGWWLKVPTKQVKSNSAVLFVMAVVAIILLVVLFFK